MGFHVNHGIMDMPQGEGGGGDNGGMENVSNQSVNGNENLRWILVFL